MERTKVTQWLTRAKQGDAAARIYLRREFNPLLRQLLRTELRMAHLSSRMPTERQFAQLASHIWRVVVLDVVHSENQLACILSRVVKLYVKRLCQEDGYTVEPLHNVVDRSARSNA